MRIKMTTVRIWVRNLWLAYFTEELHFATMIELLSIMGALGVFLFGMKIMSEGIQKVSGNQLRSVMGTISKTRVQGVVSGAFITGIIQSSSATTVMIVSFVNAGVLKLREAIGLIMGANLGTTLTFWIIYYLGYKFSLSSVSLPVIGIGLPLLFFKKPRYRDIGETLIGFGILFIGLSLLKENVPEIKSNPEALAFLQNWADMGFATIVVFILVGVVLTIVVQSSSAAGAITIALTVEGWIPIEASCAIILGENIGTTITANIASLAGNYYAKCAARAHLLFNLVGVLWMLFLFYPSLDLILSFFPLDPNDKSSVAMATAIFHSSFNMVNILILLPFVPYLEKFAKKLVSDKSKSEKDGYMQASAALPFTGELNLVATEKELRRFSKLTLKMFDGFRELLEFPNDDKTELVKDLKLLEKSSDDISRDITFHLVMCSTEKISLDSAGKVSGMMAITHEMEEICDCCLSLVKQARRKYRKNRDFLLRTEEELIQFSKMVADSMEYYDRRIRGQIEAHELEGAFELENSINRFRKEIRKGSVNRMKDVNSAKIEMICIAVLSGMERVADHSLNIMKTLCRSDYSG